MKKFFLLLLIISVFPIQLSGKPILDRAWDFKSSADVTFTINDTLSISIHFPNSIPDDRLIGYCHFRISINDSNPGMVVNGKSFMYQYQFDSGFNSFDHVLTLNINYTSGLLANKIRDPRNCRVYLDPYPVSRIHQLFPVADSNLTVDSTARILRVTYYHKRLLNNPLQKAVGGMHKELIASKGYPFDYGLFAVDSSAVIHFAVHHNIVNKLSPSQSVKIFTINGKNAGIFTSAKDPLFQLNNGCFIIQLNQGGFRENLKCATVKK